MITAKEAYGIMSTSRNNQILNENSEIKKMIDNTKKELNYVVFHAINKKVDSFEFTETELSDIINNYENEANVLSTDNRIFISSNLFNTHIPQKIDTIEVIKKDVSECLSKLIQRAAMEQLTLITIGVSIDYVYQLQLIGDMLECNGFEFKTLIISWTENCQEAVSEKNTSNNIKKNGLITAEEATRLVYSIEEREKRKLKIGKYLNEIIRDEIDKGNVWVTIMLPDWCMDQLGLVCEILRENNYRFKRSLINELTIIWS